MLIKHRKSEKSKEDIEKHRRLLDSYRTLKKNLKDNNESMYTFFDYIKFEKEPTFTVEEGYKAIDRFQKYYMNPEQKDYDKDANTILENYMEVIEILNINKNFVKK